jgi:hypothetical protein
LVVEITIYQPDLQVGPEMAPLFFVLSPVVIIPFCSHARLLPLISKRLRHKNFVNLPWPCPFDTFNGWRTGEFFFSRPK